MPQLNIEAIECKVHASGVDAAALNALAQVVRDSAALAGVASAPFIGEIGAAITQAGAAAGTLDESVVDLAVAINEAGGDPDQLYLSLSNQPGQQKIWPHISDGYIEIRGGQMLRTHIPVLFDGALDVNLWEGDSLTRDDFLGRLTVDETHNTGLRYQIISNAEGAVYVLYYTVGGQIQNNWRWCSNCQGMHFVGNGYLPCPAGGQHIDDQSGDYKLSLNDAQAPGQIWHWCHKCGGLHFTEHGNRPCPAGGSHSADGSGQYRIQQVGDPNAPDGQPDWRWCERCGGMHFMGGRPPNPGVCKAGGGHSSIGSGNYIFKTW